MNKLIFTVFLALALAGACFGQANLADSIRVNDRADRVAFFSVNGAMVDANFKFTDNAGGTAPLLTLGVAGTSVGGLAFTNATSGSVTLNAPTGALGTPTVTLPAITGSLGTGYSCGTMAAGGACANTATGGTFHAIFGIATLAANTSTITGISPAFTSSSTYFCVANDITTRANPVQAIPASASTVTFTNTTGATDNIQFVCLGY